MSTETFRRLSSRFGAPARRGVLALEDAGNTNLITRTEIGPDRTNQSAVKELFASKKPEVLFLAVARVGGITAKNTYRAG